MSMFSIPDELMPDLTKLEKMSNDLSAIMPGEMTGAANLMAHPLAGAAAASALGIGLASHAFGLWMGAVSGAAEASQRLFAPLYDDLSDDTESFADKPRSPAARARETAKILIADVRSAAGDVAETVTEATAAAVEEVKDTAVAVIEATEPVQTPAKTPLTELLPEDFRRPKALDRPETPDDLKAISGIGPKLETVLQGLGVWTHGQIAAWSREEIAWLDDYLGFKGRITRDDWTGQAAKLANSAVDGGGKPAGSVH